MNITIELDIDNDYLQVNNRTFKVVYNYESGGDGFNEPYWANLEIFHVYEYCPNQGFALGKYKDVTDLVQRTNDMTKGKRKSGWPTLWDYITDEIKKYYED